MDIQAPPKSMGDLQTVADAPLVRHDPGLHYSGAQDETRSKDNGADPSISAESIPPFLGLILGDAYGVLGVPRTKPLNILDLPMDILRMIVGEVGWICDMLALALTHSAFHSVVIPKLYSHFDIVWPRKEDEVDPRGHMDLAYGLATLAMSGTVLGPKPKKCSKCSCCGHGQSSSSTSIAQPLPRRLNDYAQFTRKFSLGNGAFKYLRTYYISMESGKMLCTLVALALARMANLETFVWDQPTGILREVWESLSSPGEAVRGSDEPPKLTNVWIRCHDSTSVCSVSQNIHFFLPIDHLSAPYELLRKSFKQIEHPNFSLLPPLKSLCVLEIDQIAYFEELSILINKSREQLRELRIGISQDSNLADQNVPENGAEGTFMDEPSSTSLGANGVIGMLMSKVCECFRRPLALPERFGMATPQGESACAEQASLSLGGVTSVSSSASWISSRHLVERLGEVDPRLPIIDEKTSSSGDLDKQSLGPSARQSDRSHITKQTAANQSSALSNKQPRKVAILEKRKVNLLPPTLNLVVLALENVPLSVNVLCRALNWRFLTDITLLRCNSDEELWRMLAKGQSKSQSSSTSGYRPPVQLTCPLRLRRIHTDGVSQSLLTVIRTVLDSNTLECLFLQDRKGYRASLKISIESIFKAIRCHRASLRKLTINSGVNVQTLPSSYQRWSMTRLLLNSITGGKMLNLRELAVSINSSDWHLLLQRLPGLPQLRSLYIPGLSPTIPIRHIEPHEMALQVLDIMTLRPELKICYVGILNRCFRIEEGKPYAAEAVPIIASDQLLLMQNPGWGSMPFLNHEISEDSSEISSEDNDTEDEALEAEEVPHEIDSDSDAASDWSTSAIDEKPRAPQLRLWPLDDDFAEHVEIFKIRHGTIC